MDLPADAEAPKKRTTRRKAADAAPAAEVVATDAAPEAPKKRTTRSPKAAVEPTEG